MSLVLATLVVVAFAVLLERLSVAGRARAVADRAARSLRVLRDSELSDAEKERALRRDAVHLAGQSGMIIGLSLLALLVPLGGVWLMDRAGWVVTSDVIAILQRIDFLVAATVVGTGAYYLSLILARE